MLESKNELDLFELSEIESIELLGEEETVDIEVEDVHMFFANEIYTHNSAMGKEKYGLDTIGESLGKAATADVVIGIGRPDDTKGNNIATIGILKNRNGADGYYLNFRFDTSKIDIEVLEDQSEPQRGNMNASFGGSNSVRQQSDAHQINGILQSQLQ